MKKKKISIIGILLFIVFSIAGCSASNGEPQFVESGLSSNANSSEPRPWLSTAVRAESKQESIVKLTVYAGYYQGFVEKFNYIFNDPSYGRFVLQRCIRNQLNIDISISYIELPDFFVESKYLISSRKESDCSFSKTFRFGFNDLIPLDEFSIERGHVCYTVRLLNEDNEVIKGSTTLLGGVHIAGLHFKKVNNEITFAKYANSLDK